MIVEFMVGWLIVGAVLFIIEFGTGTFVSLSFGLAALLLSGVNCLEYASLLPHISIELQVILFIINGIALSVILFKRGIKETDSETTGDIDYIIKNASKAFVTDVNNDKRSGKCDFVVSFMGSKSWNFFCEHEINIGDEVNVINVSGNNIKVSLINS